MGLNGNRNRQLALRGNFRNWYAAHLGVFAQSLIIGAFTGLVIVLFRLLLQFAYDRRLALYFRFRESGKAWLLLWLLALAAAGCLIGWSCQRWPMIRGGGVPHVRAALLRRRNLRWWPELPLKLLVSVLGIGCGLSLGQEGPSVQLGAYTGKAILGILRRPVVERKILLSAGAAAGLAAAFNAPLAGVLFVLEELHKHFSARLLACAMGAALSAYLVASGFFGLSPIFHFSEIEALPNYYMPAMIGLGLACAIVGHLFKETIYKFQDWFALSGIPAALRPIIPLFLSVPLAFFFFNITGGGHQLIEELATSSLSVAFLGLLLLLKIGLTAMSYGSGASGGIFLPLLACGALLGKAWGVGLESLGLVEPSLQLTFMILGMAGFFSAVVKAPITGAVLILEMSGNFSHFAGLVACCLTAYVCSDLLRSASVYDVLLDRLLANKNPADHPDWHAQAGRRLMLEIPVGLGSALAHKRIRTVAWPEGVLVVGIERGEHELVPNKNTEIEPGDCLLVLVNGHKAAEVNEILLKAGEPR